MARRYNVYVEGTKHVFVNRDNAELFMRKCREQGKSCLCPAIEAKTGIRIARRSLDLEPARNV